MQSPQNGCVTEAMTPISPAPSQVAVALGDLAAVGGLEGLERELGADGRDDLGGRHDVVQAPAVGRADVHELDVADGMARSSEAARDVEDGALVQPSLDDDVDLDRQSGRGGGVDSREHASDGEVDVVHRPEDLVVERVEADGDAREPRVGERLRLLREERGVRRQRDVEVVVDRCEGRDEVLEIAAQQRLAARDPELAHAQVDEDARDALDLLEREQLAPRQEAVLVPEDLLRHAVDAAEVAAVGDRDA